jgi:hypothetical protein
MAIDLPPVMPPQLATQQQVEFAKQYQGSYVQRDINGVLLRVQEAPYLSEAQLQAILDSADSPSTAITALSRRYYNMGHLLVGLSYFRLGDTVTVMVSQNSVKGLRGAPLLTHFFSGLVGDDSLQLHEFDRARVPASIYAERAGLEYSISYEAHADNEVILDFVEREAADSDATDVDVELNNRGSRFLGRYFARVGLAHRFATGTELKANAQTVIRDWGETGDGDDYQQVEVSVDQPLRYGLYGIDLSYIRYERAPEVVVTSSGGGFCLPPLISCPIQQQALTLPLDAEIQQASLRGEQLLFSNPLRRFNVFERLSYVDSRIEPQAGGDALLEERFVSLELGARYTLREQWLGRPVFARMEFATELGLSDDDGSLGQEPTAKVAIGRRSAEYLIAKPAVAMTLALSGNTELRLSAQGQWSDNTQLPQQRQWVLGGGSSLSAWLPGTLVGDDGVHASMAIQRQYEWRDLTLTPALFVEYGAARFNDTDDELGEWQNLADAGLGVSLEMPYGLSSHWVAALPLADDVDDEARLDSKEVDFYWSLRWQW